MKPPSPARRAFVAGAFLFAFYLSTFLLACALTASTYFLWQVVWGWGVALVTLGLWFASFTLLRGLWRARPARFVEPGRRLTREEAPALFDLLDELAQLTNTRAPERVYLCTGTQMAVTETSEGFLGRQSERVLLVGAGYLRHGTVAHVRAILAHEFGHFAGGDTRWSGLIGFAQGAVGAVLASTHQEIKGQRIWHSTARQISREVGGAWIKAASRMYLRLTRPSSRAMELAADRLAANLVGRDLFAAALREATVFAPLYEAYLAGALPLAMEAGHFPSDAAAGFERFRGRLHARGEIDNLVREQAEQKTDPFDSHPALTERLAALQAYDPGPPPDPATVAARELLAPTFDLETWHRESLSALLLKDPKPLQLTPWSELVRTVGKENVQRAAAVARERMAAWMPNASTAQCLAGLLNAVATNATRQWIARIEPVVETLPMFRRDAVAHETAIEVLGVLFAAALLEQGGELQEAFGDSSRVVLFHGETIRPDDLAKAAASHRQAGEHLYGWSQRLHAAGSPALDGSSRAQSQMLNCS